MPIRMLFASLALLATLDSHALNTENQSESSLRALGATLATSAGSSQWQQLWQRTRDAGHLTPGDTPHFTLSHPQIAEHVRATLSHADSVTPEGTTQALYRRDFQPQVLGMDKGAALSAICLWVDWRTLAQNQSSGTHMGQVSLLLSKPCP